MRGTRIILSVLCGVVLLFQGDWITSTNSNAEQPPRTELMNGETQGALAANPLAARYQSLEFGDGTDGDLTVPLGQIVTMDSETSRIVGNNAAGSSEIQVEFPGGFNQGDEVLIIKMQNREHFGQRTGQYETHRISQVVGRTFLLDSPLLHTYSTGQHQVIRIPQYRDVVIEGVLTCAAWNGFVGGVLFFRATGSVVVNESGSINASGMGYRWGRGGDSTSVRGFQGESTAGGLNLSKSRLIGSGGGGGLILGSGVIVLVEAARATLVLALLEVLLMSVIPVKVEIHMDNQN